MDPVTACPPPPAGLYGTWADPGVVTSARRLQDTTPGATDSCLPCMMMSNHCRTVLCRPS